MNKIRGILDVLQKLSNTNCQIWRFFCLPHYVLSFFSKPVMWMIWVIDHVVYLMFSVIFGFSLYIINCKLGFADRCRIILKINEKIIKIWHETMLQHLKYQQIRWSEHCAGLNERIVIIYLFFMCLIRSKNLLIGMNDGPILPNYWYSSQDFEIPSWKEQWTHKEIYFFGNVWYQNLYRYVWENYLQEKDHALALYMLRLLL